MEPGGEDKIYPYVYPGQEGLFGVEADAFEPEEIESAAYEAPPPDPTTWFKEQPLLDFDLADRAMGEQSMMLNMMASGKITEVWLEENGMKKSDLPKPIEKEEYKLIDENTQFMQNVYAHYEALVGEQDPSVFLVTDDMKDEQGYPDLKAKKPELYNFLWTNFNNLFDPALDY